MHKCRGEEMYLLERKIMIVKSILFTGLCMTYVWGANSAYCKKYAEEAVGQCYLAQYLHIPHLYPPAWQMYYDAHKKWCELPFTSRQMAKNEIQKRKQLIDVYYQKINPVAQLECIIHKQILSNGAVETKYCDGRIKTKSRFGTLIKYPDGHTEETKTYVTYKTNVMEAHLPKEPQNDAVKMWINVHAQKLLDIIKFGIQDEEAFKAYQNYEDSNLSIFQKMEKRTQTLEYFMTP